MGMVNDLVEELQEHSLERTLHPCLSSMGGDSYIYSVDAAGLGETRPMRTA